ncbi:MAG: transposase [Nevskiales bacterium]
MILDGTSVMSRRRVALVVQDVRRRPVTWAFAERESYESWRGVLGPLSAAGIEPRFVVCDGQKGLLKAIRSVWPRIVIQRCLLHVMRQAKLWLTQHPKTEAGQALLHLVRRLFAIRTKRQRRRWLRAYRGWLRRHHAFLKQRTYHPTAPRRWWYTHRKLRAVRSLLTNSLGDLFCYTRYPEIPRTTNHVEGGINSRLKDLYRRHRGLSLERKTILTAWYLTSRQASEKPTRNFL